MEHLVSAEYKEMLVEKHGKGLGGWGGAVRGREDIIYKYMQLSKSKTLLDYGSGSGDLKRALGWEHGDKLPFSVHEYDPGQPGLDNDPPICDASICIDVMEHVETDKVDNVIKHIYDKTNNFTMQNIALTAAKGSFPNHTNLHLTIEKSPWWLEKLGKYWDFLEIISSRGALYFVATKKEQICD
jgi:hypothetical protein